MITAFIDGACNVNPHGAMGIGVAIYKGDDLWKHHTEGFPPKQGNSNNVAEYKALEWALQELVREGMTREPIVVKSDSEMLVKQMSKRYGVKNGYYKDCARECLKYTNRFTNLRYEWIAREDNVECDILSKEGLKQVA